MRPNTFYWFLLPFCGFFLLVSCSRESKNKPSETQPQVFTPTIPEGDSISDVPLDTAKISESNSPKTFPKKLPSRAELEKITPNQEAKRALTNDAMKAAEMSLTEFGNFMKTRIPYYKGKGELKFENDIVKIHITKSVMLIQTPKGTLTFSM